MEWGSTVRDYTLLPVTDMEEQPSQPAHSLRITLAGAIICAGWPWSGSNCLLWLAW